MQTLATVVGKTQNRTALGIVHAYVTINPKATLAELRRVFPNNLCPDSGVDEILVTKADALALNKKHDMSLYFTKDAEVITLGNGAEVCLSQIWSKASLTKFVTNAANLGIQAAEPDKALDYDASGFKYELLVQPKKKRPMGLILGGVFVVVIAIVAWLALRPSGGEQAVVEKQVVKTDTVTVTVHDTVLVQQTEEIEREFNAAQFEKNKAELNDRAKLALHDLANLLRAHAELRLSIEGHTSADGSDEHNMQLSEARAKAAYEFLIQTEQIEATRLAYKGFGSTQPISDNPEENRRIEFRIEE